MVPKSGWVPRGFHFCVVHMARISPDLIEQTITVFESWTGRVISQEEARQAVENISGFFRVLQEWAEPEDKEGCEDGPCCLHGIEGGTS